MLYVYAITADPADDGDGHLSEEGILPDAPVLRLSWGALAAVASPVPDAVFAAAPLRARLEDEPWARARVLAHERVVSSLLPHATVLPLKFCTLFTSEVALGDAIATQRPALEAAVERLRGTREWGVKLFYAPPAPPARVPEAIGAGVIAAGAGTAFFRRKKDEQQARIFAEAALDHCVADSHRSLADTARAAVFNPVQAAEVHGQRGIMALNGAYLVAQENEPAFRACLADLAQTYAPEGIRYALTGPWGAYNFVGGGLAGA